MCPELFRTQNYFYIQYLKVNFFLLKHCICPEFKNLIWESHAKNYLFSYSLILLWQSLLCSGCRVPVRGSWDKEKWVNKKLLIVLITMLKYYPVAAAAAAAKSLQSCPTLCDPIDGSPSGSPIPGILQARTLEWVAISFSNAWKWKVKVKSLTHVQLLATPWAAAYQAPPSMEFSRREYWSGLPVSCRA